MTTAWRNAHTATLTTTQRGYGSSHQKARAQAAAQHHPSDPCSRCGHPLGPMGHWLHYDHRDDRSGYLGFSHGKRPCPWCGKRCNEQAAASAGGVATYLKRGWAPSQERTLRW